MKVARESIFGSGQPLITGGQLKELPMCMPKKPEHLRIADSLSALDARIAAEADKLAALKRHKQGLMQQLFSSPEGALPGS
jgi:type I restriction enzyme S subunit